MTRQRMLKWTASLVFGLAACGPDVVDGPPDSILLTVVCSISESNFNPTLLKAEALIDGQVVGQDQSAPAAAVLLPGGGMNVGAGAHSVGCRIVSQTASPTVYETSAESPSGD